MLLEVRIQNLAIIDTLQLKIPEGLVVISGETGAGKSILLHALGLLSGNRANRQMIRTGTDALYVEGLFTTPTTPAFQEILQELGLQCGPQFSISRTIMQNGRSIIRVDGIQISLVDLQRIGPFLIDVYGQNDRNLLDASKQASLLDTFLSEEGKNLLASYVKDYENLKKIDRFLAANRPDEQAIEREKDLLLYEIDEIAAFDLENTDVDMLLQEHTRALHTEEIEEKTMKLLTMISNDRETSLFDFLYPIESTGNALSRIDEAFPTETFVEAQELLRDYQSQVESYLRTIETDPEHLQILNEKVELWTKLQRKYGQTKEEILDYDLQLKERLHALDALTKKVLKYEQERVKITKSVQEKGDLLFAERKTIAQEIDRKVQNRLQFLKMEKAKFQIDVSESENYHGSGKDSIVFLLQPNPGLAMKPLHEIASGGELSRVMLAIRSVFLETLPSYTVVFDEIDAGVSGYAAQAMAEQLYLLSQHMQIIAVTHMPQLASMGDSHIYISKTTEENQTKSKIQTLDTAMRSTELSRMISANHETESALVQAKTLLENQSQWKEEQTHGTERKNH